MKRPVQLSSQTIALMLGTFLAIAFGLVLFAATALAQTPAPVPTTTFLDNPIVKAGIGLLWPTIAAAVGSAIVVYSSKGFAMLKAWGDAKIKNDNFRTAWDHFNDALANAVLHVEQAERPNIAALGSQFIQNGKLTPDGAAKAQAAAIASLKADAAPSLTVVQQTLGLVGQGFEEFLQRAVNAQVAKQKAV